MLAPFNSLLFAPGVFLGSALGGSLASGVPVLDIMQSMQGSIGVTIGYMAGTVVNDSQGSYTSLIGAAVVPLLAGGVVDRALLGLVVGGIVGVQISNSLMKPQKKEGQQ